MQATTTSSSTVPISTLLDRARMAFLLMFTADALSMPAHWFYDPSQIPRYFGKDGITKMKSTKGMSHPSSIMNLHSTKAGGRIAALTGRQAQSSKEVVGDVILKGKRHLWNNKNQHYHHEFDAGENTLNAWCARWFQQLFASSSSSPSSSSSVPSGFIYDQNAWIKTYVQKMQEPESHPDSYPESYHRGFFQNYLEAAEKASSPSSIDLAKLGAVTHDTPSVGGLMNICQLSILELIVDRDVKRVQSLARSHLSLTHPHKNVYVYADHYVQLIDSLLYRRNDDETEKILRKAASNFMKVDDPQGPFERLMKEGIPSSSSSNSFNVYPREALMADQNVVGGSFSLACYLDDSYPNILYLANKYFNLPSLGLLANTNLGGENVHRGFCLATVLGLAYSPDRVPKESSKAMFDLVKQLKHYDEISKEVDAVLGRVRQVIDERERK